MEKTKQPDLRDSFISELEKLVNLQITYGYKKGWIFHRIKETFSDSLTLDEYEALATLLEYKKGWAKIKFDEQQLLKGDGPPPPKETSEKRYKRKEFTSWDTGFKEQSWEEYWEGGGRHQFYDSSAKDEIPDKKTGLTTSKACKFLELLWPCKKDAVKTAYRKLSKKYHPDCGGKQADFIHLTNCFEYLIKRAH